MYHAALPEERKAITVTNKYCNKQINTLENDVQLFFVFNYNLLMEGMKLLAAG